jgi:hypothetical protein
MKFDYKKDAIKHYTSILDDDCSVVDNGNEILFFAADPISLVQFANTNDPNDIKSKLYYKVVYENGKWESYGNNHGTMVKMNG